MVKLVFVDMDDTFLSPDKTISAENLRILDVAVERGVQFVPCTGRNATGLPRQLVEHPCVRYAVCCNGAIICEAKSGRVLSEVDIEKDVVRSLYADVRDEPITFDIFADGKVFTAADRWHVMDEMGVPPQDLVQIKAVRTRVDGTVDQIIEQVGEIYRVNVFYLTQAAANAVHAAVDARPELTRSRSLACNVEITNRNAVKGFGVRWLAEHLGVAIEDTHDRLWRLRQRPHDARVRRRRRGHGQRQRALPCRGRSRGAVLRGIRRRALPGAAAAVGVPVRTASPPCVRNCRDWGVFLAGCIGSGAAGLILRVELPRGGNS